MRRHGRDNSGELAPKYGNVGDVAITTDPGFEQPASHGGLQGSTGHNDGAKVQEIAPLVVWPPEFEHRCFI